MKTKKTIVFIITGLNTGGAETMLLKILENIDRERFFPFVISLTSKGEIGPRIEALGIQVEALNIHWWSVIGKFLKLVRQIRIIHPDAVHTWMYHADLVGGIAARLAGIKNVAWCIRNSDLSQSSSRFSTRMIMHISAILSNSLPRNILCCSKVAMNVHVNEGYNADKMTVIPNGFSLERFFPDQNMRKSVRDELDLRIETPLVGLIARYDPQKNHKGFLEAASVIHRRFPQVHFLLAGKDVVNSNHELVNDIKYYNISEVIHLLGKREDVPRLMAALDILVSSSSYGEAFPNVLGEAMACGIPCVVTNVGDSAEIVEETGWVVEPSDMNGLAEGVIKVLAMPEDERQVLGQKARLKIKNNFEITKITIKYEEFYEELMKN